MQKISKTRDVINPEANEDVRKLGAFDVKSSGIVAAQQLDRRMRIDSPSVLKKCQKADGGIFFVGTISDRNYITESMPIDFQVDFEQ